MQTHRQADCQDCFVTPFLMAHLVSSWTSWLAVSLEGSAGRQQLVAVGCLGI